MYLVIEVHMLSAVVNMGSRWNIWLKATVIPNCIIIIIM
jgi:hypothetical protein